ncbi:MAG: hypothetical protein P8080_06655 [Gammaproteobacteria bacterium]
MTSLRNTALVLASAALAFSAQAFADHNSKNGEGWANMPNDIHNTRIETRTSGDAAAFKDFVKNGEGADSVNRFDDGDEGATPRQVQQKSMPEEGKASDAGRKEKVQQTTETRQSSRVQQSTGPATEAGQARQERRTVETRQSSRVRESVGRGDRGAPGGHRGGGRGGR